MTSPIFTLADPDSHRDALLQLNIEYLSWTGAEIEKLFDLSFIDLTGVLVPEYVNSTIDKVCGDPPPRGVFYLVEYDGLVAGMGGLRTVRDGVCELKRVYVRPTFRGKQLGETILHRMLDDASNFGFQKMVLDTGPFMRSAHRLYEAAGFSDCPPYPEAEVPAALHHGWRFMERTI